MSSESYDSVLLLVCQLSKDRIIRHVRNTNGPSKQRHGSRRECLVVEITFETFPELGVLLWVEGVRLGTNLRILAAIQWPLGRERTTGEVDVMAQHYCENTRKQSGKAEDSPLCFLPRRARGLHECSTSGWQADFILVSWSHDGRRGDDGWWRSEVSFYFSLGRLDPPGEREAKMSTVLPQIECCNNKRMSVFYINVSRVVTQQVFGTLFECGMSVWTICYPEQILVGTMSESDSILL